MEVPIKEAQMNEAIRKAILYDVDKSPYGYPIHPYVWRWNAEYKAIRLEMGRDDLHRRLVGMFSFDSTSLKPGVTVHVSVFIMTDESKPDWGSIPSHDVRFHSFAVIHFKGELLGAPSTYIPQVVPPPPPPDEAPLPPPPNQRAS